MAERSFTKEVQSLRLGQGMEFRGEAILAVTKALLQSGVAYVGGYQGAPISHLMDVLADAADVLSELGVHFEASASEATAAAMLAASINYPLRGAVTWKSTVGTNVASDALSNLASAGVKGGALIILGEDYGEGASIMQERTHAFAMKSQIWLLDPRPQLQEIVRAVERGFELSEASHTPVMLMLRVRACHVYGRFVAKDNLRPAFSAADALAHPVRDYGRIILPPSTYAQEQRKNRAATAGGAAFHRRARTQRVDRRGKRGRSASFCRADCTTTCCARWNCSTARTRSATSEVPLYVLNVTYPLVAEEWRRFCGSKRAVLIVEEGQPEYLEQAASQILRQADVAARIVGKDVLPMHGEYTVDVLRQGLGEFLDQWAPGLRTARAATPAREVPLVPAAKLAALVPARPSGLCTGCPERPFFSALKLLQKETGPLHISADIGCHSFATLPPFNMGNSIMGYGLGAAAASAFGGEGGKRAVSVMGDGGFWHNGLTSGIGNAVFNKHDDLTVIIDNGYSAATGGQDIPSSRAANVHRQGNNSIVDAVKGVGVRWVRRTHTYNMRETLKVLREALSTDLSRPQGDRGGGRMPAESPAARGSAAAPGNPGRRARGDRAFRRRPGYLHGRSLLHPPVRLPVAHREGEPRSAAQRSGRSRRQHLRRLRRVRRGGRRRRAVPLLLSG